MKGLVVIIILLLSIMNDLHAQAPTFIGEAGLPPRETDGFYRVLIPPAISAYTGARHENLRIVDERNNEVPYFLHEAKAYTTQQFVAYKILQKEQQSGCCTSLVLENIERNTINNILLQIKNAEITKSATLSGSDDQKQWYALKEHFILAAISNPNQTSEIRIVDFPLSNYAYYRLQIDDSSSAPLNIVGAGYYKRIHESGIYTPLEDITIKITENAEEKRTYCAITLDTTQWVDRLTIAASGPPYFLRRAALYQHTVRYDKRGDPIPYRELVSAFDIRSKDFIRIELPEVKTKTLSLIINNEDNPPLHLDSLKVYQLNRYLVTYLEKGHHYKLKVGDTAMPQPVYDLAHFKTSIPEDLAIVVPGAFESYHWQASTPEPLSIFNNKRIIWIAIAGIVVVMALMSFKMIREARIPRDKDEA